MAGTQKPFPTLFFLCVLCLLLFYITTASWLMQANQIPVSARVIGFDCFLIAAITSRLGDIVLTVLVLGLLWKKIRRIRLMGASLLLLIFLFIAVWCTVSLSAAGQVCPFRPLAAPIAYS